MVFHISATFLLSCHDAPKKLSVGIVSQLTYAVLCKRVKPFQEALYVLDAHYESCNGYSRQQAAHKGRLQQLFKLLKVSSVSHLQLTLMIFCALLSSPRGLLDTAASKPCSCPVLLAAHHHHTCSTHYALPCVQSRLQLRRVSQDK